jgi:hypothetical protein
MRWWRPGSPMRPPWRPLRGLTAHTLLLQPAVPDPHRLSCHPRLRLCVGSRPALQGRPQGAVHHNQGVFVPPPPSRRRWLGSAAEADQLLDRGRRRPVEGDRPLRRPLLQPPVQPLPPKRTKFREVNVDICKLFVYMHVSYNF